MTPWVQQWERQCAAHPGALAVTNDRGQTYSYGELRSRALSMEQRYQMFGLTSGDRLAVNWARHQSLDDIVVAMWACGLRDACFAPWWKDFSKAQVNTWCLLENYAPRLKLDPEQGEGKVYPLPGSLIHHMAFAWPERSMEGSDRASEAVEWRWISHDELSRAVSNLRSKTGMDQGDLIVWIDPGLGGLGWLTIVCALSVGASVSQVPIVARRTPGFFDLWMESTPCEWLIPSADWLSCASGPTSHPSKGVIANWGQALPHVRQKWGQYTRWLDIWAPASCGWWWGCREWDGKLQDPFLPDELDTPDWRVEDGVLHLMNEEGAGHPIAYVVQDKQGEHSGLHIALSGLPDRQAREAWHASLVELRLYPRIGDVRSVEFKSEHCVGVLPRSHEESPQHIMDDIKERLQSSVKKEHMRNTRVMVADAYIPRDETGQFDVSGLKRLTLSV